MSRTVTFYLVDDRNPSGYAQVLEEYQGVWTNNGASGWARPVALSRAYNYGSALISQQQFDPNTLLPSVLSYYGYDGHGSVRFLMDGGGGITDAYTFDAFGNLLAQNGSTPNNYLYCGQQWDSDLGLYYNRARYLNTGVGRFWTMDGDYGNNEDPLSLHKYIYTEDDPVDMVDPLGLAGESDATAFGRAVERVIRNNFWSQSSEYRGAIGRSLGYLVNQPALGPLRQRVDLYNRQPGNDYIFEVKPVNDIISGARQIRNYLTELQRFDPTWRNGTLNDYYYWDAINGPIIKSDLSGVPLPGGQNALVFPPIFGVITYLPIPPDFPQTFSNFIYADFLMESQTVAVEGETAAASEAAAITPEAMGIEQLTETAIEMGRLGQLTMYVGEAGTAGIEAETGIAAEDALMDGGM